MKTRTLLILAGTLLILGGCAAKPQDSAIKNVSPAVNEERQNQASSESGLTETEDSSGQDNGEIISGNMNTLLGLGRSMHCTYEKSQTQGKITGDMYIDNNKYSLEVTFPDSGKFFTIGDTEWVYTWNTRVSGGAKTKIEDKDVNSVGDEAVESTNQENYTCVPWVADELKFIPPSDMVFVDETAEIKEMESQMQDGNDPMLDECSACDNLPDPTLKNRCLVNSGCKE